MVERNIKQELWIKEELIVIEDVPAGVCPECGEKIVKADIGQQVAAIVADSKRLQKARTMRIPVVQFVKEVA